MKRFTVFTSALCALFLALALAPSVRADEIKTSYKIKTESGEEFAKLKIYDSGKTKFEAPGGTTLVGKGKSTGKVKYEVDGKTLYEIKPSDDGFKLRTADGKLLWKVKFYDDKIKISDNEENENPCQLRMKGADRVKVEKGDKELGNVKFYADDHKVKVKNEADKELYQINDSPLSVAYGVLFIDMPKDQQGVLMLELLKRR